VSRWDAAHAVAVAEAAPVDLRVAAFLHDAFEDDLLSYDDLRFVFGEDVADTVGILTRRGEQYGSYIARVGMDRAATLVKIADLRVNLARMDAAHESLRPRYEKALTYLLSLHHGDLGSPPSSLAGGAVPGATT
jgi:(p)ppGpp synthase/HD superfamily hydrolase